MEKTSQNNVDNFSTSRYSEKSKIPSAAEGSIPRYSEKSRIPSVAEGFIPNRTERPVPNRAEGSANQTYTLSEVAKYLDINEGTLRNWEKRFGEFLSNYRNQYNHRVFTDTDIKTLERVKGLVESGLFTQTGVKHMIASQQGSSVSQNQERGLQATDRQAGGGFDEEYKEKLLIALNSVGSEIHALRREMREDLRGALKRDIEHLTLLLFPPEEKAKPSPWWKFW